MASDRKQLLLRCLTPILFGLWLAWLISPSIVVGNLHLLERHSLVPGEITHAMETAYQTIWAVGVVVISMIAIASLIVDHTGDNATKAQSDYERRRLD